MLEADPSCAAPPLGPVQGQGHIRPTKGHEHLQDLDAGCTAQAILQGKDGRGESGFGVWG